MMQIHSIDNNLTFGKKTGGVKYLKIIGGKKSVRFFDTTPKTADARIFVAGGRDVDKKVQDANIRAMKKCAADKTNANSGANSVLLYFAGLLDAFGFKKPLNRLISSLR